MDNPKAPSFDIEDVVRHAGSIHISCELCDRVHFASASPGFFDKGELEELLEKKKAAPDKYIEDTGSDYISYGHIDGKQAVIGCPCNGLTRYEEFIFQNRHMIVDYLNRRTKARLDKAQSEAGKVAALKGRLP